MASSGLRVIRGPGWGQGEADGGEGHVGTVVGTTADGTAQVLWDGGQVVTCRAGSRDLRVMDNATIGIRHPGVVCDECHEQSIVGMRWKCCTCDDFDLCSLCYFNDSHDRNHQFQRYETPQSDPVKMERRSRSLKIRVMGIFPDATVVRGKDWEFKDQDGGSGKEGTVVDLLTPADYSARSTVRVKWNSGGTNVYRVGFKGKMDLKYTEESPGGECYPDHLPIFDASNYKSVTTGAQVSLQDGISEGDKVVLNLSPDKIQQLRAARSDICQVLDKTGQVQGVTENGEAVVAFGPRKYKISASVLKKVSVGDKVRVLDDKERLEALQDGHGGSNKEMRKALGKVGEAVKVDSDGDVVVDFQGQKWLFNPACLTPAPGQSVDDISGQVAGGDDDDSDDNASGINMLGQLMGAIAMAAASQARQQVGGMVFLKAIIDNEVSTVRDLLQREPKLGHLEITKLLVEKGALLNQRDRDGDTPLNAGMKFDAIADFLIKKGCDVTIANNNGQTPSHKAAAYGHSQILRLLMANGADFNAVDKAGDTPLHDAITHSRTSATEVLIGWPRIDVRRKNKKGFTPLQYTAFKGEASIAELLVSKDRNLVNEQKEDGFAALHVAAINNYTDVMKVLLEKEAYMDAVQLLLKHGADVNAKDSDGDRPLHILMCSHTQPGGQREMFLLLLIGATPRVKAEERVRIACYLLQAGADPEARNDNGKTALEVCGNQTIVDNVKRFLDANPVLRRQQRATSAAEARQRSSTADNLCRKCCFRPANVLIVPCGHKAVCISCCKTR
ncbi:hypothetical protein BaRGS_00022958, partial [Batillaria attramentaria]